MKMLSLIGKFMVRLTCLQIVVDFVVSTWQVGLLRTLANLYNIVLSSLLFQVPRLVVKICKTILVAMAKLILSVFDVGLAMAWAVVPGLAAVFPLPRLSAIVPLSPFYR